MGDGRWGECESRGLASDQNHINQQERGACECTRKGHNRTASLQVYSANITFKSKIQSPCTVPRRGGLRAARTCTVPHNFSTETTSLRAGEWPQVVKLGVWGALSPDLF